MILLPKAVYVTRTTLIYERTGGEVVRLLLNLPPPFPGDPTIEAHAQFMVRQGTGLRYIQEAFGAPPDEILDLRDKHRALIQSP